MRRLLLDLDSYDGIDPLGTFPLFLKRTPDVLTTRLSVVFGFVARLAGDITMSFPIPNGPSLL